MTCRRGPAKSFAVCGSKPGKLGPCLLTEKHPRINAGVPSSDELAGVQELASAPPERRAAVCEAETQTNQNCMRGDL